MGGGLPESGGMLPSGAPCGLLPQLHALLRGFPPPCASARGRTGRVRPVSASPCSRTPPVRASAPPVTGTASARRTSTLSPIAINQPGFGAHERLGLGVVVEIFAAQRTDRQKPVRAGLVQLHEGAEARDATDPAGEGGADAVRQEGRKVAVVVSRSAAMDRRSVLGDVLGRLVQTLDLLGSDPSLPQPWAAISARCTTRSE